MRTTVRPEYATLRERLRSPVALIQVVAGPRKVGKTTLVRQVLEGLGRGRHVETADALGSPEGSADLPGFFGPVVS